MDRLADWQAATFHCFVTERLEVKMWRLIAKYRPRGNFNDYRAHRAPGGLGPKRLRDLHAAAHW
jgi:hypothetical protein